jgi:lipid-A-disaccharide synthase
VRLLLPRFREAVGEIAREIPGLVCLLPTVPHVEAHIRAATGDWPSPLHVLTGEADKFAAFDAADAALAASGTVTTELALAGTPMVVAYRLGWLTYALARPFISVKFITLVNIILDRAAVPELIQQNCTGPSLAAAVLHLLRGGADRERQRRDLAEAASKLGAGGERPSLRAAHALLEFARSRRK